MIRVVKIELRNFGHYYERADNIQAVMGMIESHLQDSFEEILCLRVEMMDENEFNNLPEFTGF